VGWNSFLPHVVLLRDVAHFECATIGLAHFECATTCSTMFVNVDVAHFKCTTSTFVNTIG